MKEEKKEGEEKERDFAYTSLLFVSRSSDAGKKTTTSARQRRA